jgi:hypothetical protein
MDAKGTANVITKTSARILRLVRANYGNSSMYVNLQSYQNRVTDRVENYPIEDDVAGIACAEELAKRARAGVNFKG